jgi:hypothetical protein
MTVADSIKAQLDEAEHVIREQMTRIEELTAENERLRTGAGAHQVLQSIYRNPDAPEGNRIKAANAAISYEQPKIGSVLPSLGNVSRAERWRVYERWSQRRQYIIEHRAIPPAGWDDHLQPETYQEPEGTEMPPVDVLDTPQGFKVLSNLLPKPGQRRILGKWPGRRYWKLSCRLARAQRRRSFQF